MSRERNKKFRLTSLSKGQLAAVLSAAFILISAATYGVLYIADKALPKTEAQHTSEKGSSMTTVKEEVKDPYVLSETEDAGWEYLDGTLFLGDSNTVRFMRFSSEEGRTYTTKQNTIAVVGMGITAINSLKCEQMSTGTYSMVESVGIIQPQRVFITFGTNNLGGYATPEAFAEAYANQLTKIQEAYPYADLIVNSIPPLSATCVYRDLKIEMITAWNEAIRKMCREHKWYYLNSYEVLYDEATGYAYAGMMDGDGLHLSVKAVDTLFDYIRTHALETEDRRPQLASIPTIIGPKDNLYTVDPLSTKPFTSDVTNPKAQQAEPKKETEVKEETKKDPEPTPETKPEKKPEPTPETKPEPTPEPTPTPTPEPTPEPTPAPTPETKPDPTPEPKPEPEPEPSNEEPAVATETE